MTWKNDRQEHAMAARGIKVNNYNLNITSVKDKSLGEELYKYKGHVVHLHKNFEGVVTAIRVYPFDNNRTTIDIYIDEKDGRETSVKVNWPGTSMRNTSESRAFAKALVVATDLAMNIEKQIKR
jgi:hypothetical protein